jgi:hypothetical protein
MNTDPEVLYCMCVGGLISAGVCSLYGGLVFGKSQGSRLIETVSPSTVSSSSLASFSLSLVQPQGSAASVHWLGANICLWLFHLLCSVFWKAVRIGPILWALYSFSNSVIPSELPLSWIPLWACHSTFFSSDSFPFHPCSSSRQE